MGQKSNTLTLRKHKDTLNSYASNSKAFLNSNEYEANFCPFEAIEKYTSFRKCIL